MLHFQKNNIYLNIKSSAHLSCPLTDIIAIFFKVSESFYLKVFWTGANVVSATITASECHELAKVKICFKNSILTTYL